MHDADPVVDVASLHDRQPESAQPVEMPVIVIISITVEVDGPMGSRDVAGRCPGPRVTLLGLGQRLSLVPSRLDPGRVPVRRPAAIDPTGTDVWLFTGCVMDAWLRDTHHSTARVLDALGVTYAAPDRRGACCGALHVHAGLHDDARSMAIGVITSMPEGTRTALADQGRIASRWQRLGFSLLRHHRALLAASCGEALLGFGDRALTPAHANESRQLPCRRSTDRTGPSRGALGVRR